MSKQNINFQGVCLQCFDTAMCTFKSHAQYKSHAQCKSRAQYRHAKNVLVQIIYALTATSVYQREKNADTDSIQLLELNLNILLSSVDSTMHQ